MLDLLPQTLASLSGGGFDCPHLFVDGCNAATAAEYERRFKLPVTVRGRRVRTAGNWVLTLSELYYLEPEAEFYAVFQDDFRCVRNLRTYLEKNPWPEPGFANLITQLDNEKIVRGKRGGTWHEAGLVWGKDQKTGEMAPVLYGNGVTAQTGRGAVALAFSRAAVVALLGQPHMFLRAQNKPPHASWNRVDGGVVAAMNVAGFREYIHAPSLVSHSGYKSTVRGPHEEPFPEARTFPEEGENFDALQLLEESKDARPVGNLVARVPRVGSLVYATDSGLGILAKAMVDHGIITHPFVVRHPNFPTHDDWFPGAPQTNIRPIDRHLFARWLDEEKIDLLFFLETPFDWGAIHYAQYRGVATALMVMHECTPARLPFIPDHLIWPSLLTVPQFSDIPSTFLPVPVEVTWRRRQRADVFIHNAGHGGLNGRNGTKELLDAMRYVESPIRLLVRSQKPIIHETAYEDPRVEITVGTVPREKLFSDGDVFVFPEKHCGLSLPLQEAYASGMLVMAGNRFPMNTWLPNEPLIPVSDTRPNRLRKDSVEYDEAVYDPVVIARTIDELYNRDISDFSLSGKKWALENSWESVKPRYEALIQSLL